MIPFKIFVHTGKIRFWQPECCCFALFTFSAIKTWKLYIFFWHNMYIFILMYCFFCTSKEKQNWRNALWKDLVIFFKERHFVSYMTVKRDILHCLHINSLKLNLLQFYIFSCRKCHAIRHIYHVTKSWMFSAQSYATPLAHKTLMEFPRGNSSMILCQVLQKITPREIRC